MRHIMTILVSRIAVGIAILLLATRVFAAPPQMFSYQGRLTDPGGNPVPDGVYSVEFQIWNAPAAGLSLWSSGSVAVTTSDGLFSAKLGQSPQPALPVAIFYDSLAYLGITVGIDPEIVPRTQLVSSPYSLTTGTIENAQAGRIYGELRVSAFGNDYLRSNQIDNSFSTYNTGGLEASRIWGPNFGEVIANDNIGFPRARLGGGFGSPYLALFGSGESIQLQPDALGDLSVDLPTDAINSVEMLDEPGISQNIGSVGLFSAPGVPDNIVSVTITTPASGYILLLADGQSSVIGPAGSNTQIQFGLGEVSGGFPANGTFLAGSQATPTNEAIHDQFSNSATYFKPAGTYNFYLTGFRGNATTLAFFSYCHLKALFIPTSYGPVIGPVPPKDAAYFSSTHELTDHLSSSTVKLVDLRELELKVAKEKAELQSAEIALLKEKMKQNQDLVKKDQN